MARLTVAVCDQCGAQAPLRSTGFGEWDIPVGWVMVKQISEGSIDAAEIAHLCSWACVERFGCIRGGAWRGEDSDAE